MLVGANDIRPILDKALKADIWPALVKEFGIEQLAENHEAVAEAISASLATELGRDLDQLVTQAAGELRSAHAGQGED